MLRVQTSDISDFFKTSDDTFTNFEKNKNKENIVHPLLSPKHLSLGLCNLVVE